uniref:Reverse transcriptase domain-containing protein n=1 Tax=Tanacetum cinerariifolium TaxID=118510 RepID=A0A6L2MGM9_TANCI|nr:reverse transcriptase domain-containing protein [Tanacetum cinerariifolium]GEV10313.1 reverse transcriptase domain-containing protein [Tanacetum cinerariifolium]
MYKLESRDVKGALECMRISEFVHGITNHELIKRLYDKILKTVNEMMRVTTSFLRGEVAALNHERKKSFLPWKQHKGNQKQNFKKEVFETNKGHNTDECMHLRKQIEEMLKAGKLSHMIKEIKQNNGKEQPKSPYNGIIGRPGVRKLQAVPSTAHGMLKILVEGGVIPQKSSKNAGATYQRLVDKAFYKQIGRNLEVYVDDLVIKSHTEDEIVRDRNHCHSLKLRKKCTKKSDFHWTTKAEEAFKKIKQLIAELPMLMTPMEKEELIIYLVTAKETVSTVLMTEREARQMPIYFVSRALRGPELNYTSMEKSVLALVHASKRLKRPKVSVKGQILADFIVERPEEDSLDTPMEEEGKLPELWILFTDGSSCIDGSGAGLILTNLEGMEFTYALRFRFDATNNEAEYEALIAELQIAKQMEADMIRYLEKVKALTGSFRAFSIKQISKSENKEADALSKLASTSFAHLSNQVLVEELKEKSIGKMEILAVVEEEEDTCVTPLFKYLVKRTLPADVKKARAIRRKSWRFAVINETLYKFVPWPMAKMRGATLGQLYQLLLVYHAQGRKDANKSMSRLPEGLGKVKFLIVAMDYFTKWIKAKLVTTITGNQIKKFMWDNIVCKFGLHEEIISDNGKQFQDDPFKDWCEKLCIRQHFASAKHSQTNGLVETANRSLGEGIKARLDAKSKNWIEELPRVLWAHRTIIKSSNGDTPFSLTYGTEAVIPAEIGIPTLRTTKVDLVGNNEALEINLDLLKERKEEAAIREAKSKAKMEKYYNSKVRNTSFKPRDLVYRNNDVSRAEDTWKLSPK